MSIPAQREYVHPALVSFREERARGMQNRIADAISRFAGSMSFVYVHVVWFTVWIVFGVEKYPFGLLTMIVSLEAIFLSTFVLITQNRQDHARQHQLHQEWLEIQKADNQNEQLLELTKEVLAVTKAIRERSHP